MLEGVTLYRLVIEGLYEKAHFSRDLNEEREQAMCLVEVQTFQIKVAESAKALKQECV